jgi:hypothetical protein
MNMTQHCDPIVNNNGTAKADLLTDRLIARDAIREALNALSACKPHARDYQTAPAGTYEQARELYAERFAFLDRLHNELLDEAVRIQEQ